MRKEIQFCVDNKERASPIALPAYVPDHKLYSAVWKIATEHWGVHILQQSDTLAANVPEDEPHIPEAFALLRQAGWMPYYGQFVPPELKDSRFLVRRLRYYERHDFDEPEYLTIHRWGNWDPVIGYVGVKGGLYVGKVVGAKWKSRYGIIDNARSPSFVNDELKRDLEEAGLIGLTFLPVLWDQPAKAKGQFWQLSSSIIMPRCLLPILDVPETPTPWRTYDDGGHFPQELVFRRSEVKAMEPFDVALTSPEEDICCGPNSWTRTVVVSQRCRQVFRKLKLTTAELIPARLVPDDWHQTDSDHQK